MSGSNLALGASGKFAGMVTSALAERRAHVRGFVLDKADAQGTRDNGARDAEGSLNRHEVAALMSDALGKRIAAEKTDVASLPGVGVPQRAMFEHYDRTSLRGNALTLEAVLGRKPRSLAAFFSELANSGSDGAG